MREIAWPEKAVARQGISRERDSIMDKIKEIKNSITNCVIFQ